MCDDDGSAIPRSVWTSADIQRAADEEGSQLPTGCTLGTLVTHPNGVTRDRIASMLRFFVAIPDE